MRNEKTKKEFFQELYEKYYKLVYMRISSGIFYKNKQNIEDCTSNVFLIAIRNYDKLKEQPYLDTYLISIANKVIWNFNTRFTTKLLKEDFNIELENIQDSSDIEQQIDNEIISQEIRNQGIYKKIMSNLNQEQRELYSLRYIQKLSYDEIANLYDTKNVTIRKRISRLKLCIINEIQKFLNFF